MDSKSHSPKFPLPLLPPVWQNFDLQNFVRHAATLGVQANRVTPFDPMYVLSLASVSLNLASWFWFPSKIGGGLHRNPANLDKLLAKAPDIHTQRSCQHVF
jgi:hypothetical protein